MLDRFTETAKQLVAAARSLAESSNKQEIENEHILRAMFDHPNSCSWKILIETNTPWYLIDASFQSVIGSPSGGSSKITGFSANFKKAIERVFAIVQELGHNWISSAVILQGIFESGSAVSEKLLRSWGINSKMLNEKIRMNGDVGGSLETSFHVAPIDAGVFDLSHHIDDHLSKVFEQSITIAKSYQNDEVNVYHLLLSLAFLASRGVIDVSPLDPSLIDLTTVKDLTTPKLAPAETPISDGIVFSQEVRSILMTAIHEALSYGKSVVGVVDFAVGLSLIQPSLAQAGLGCDHLSLRRLMLGAPRVARTPSEPLPAPAPVSTPPAPPVTIPPVSGQLPPQPVVFPQISLRRYNADKGAVITIPQKFAEEWGVMALNINDNVLTVAMVNPSDVTVISKLRELTGMEIAVIKTEDKDLRAGFRMNY